MYMFDQHKYKHKYLSIKFWELQRLCEFPIIIWAEEQAKAGRRGFAKINIPPPQGCLPANDEKEIYNDSGYTANNKTEIEFR